MEKKTYITFALPLIKQLYFEPTKAIQQIELFAINARALQYNVTVEDVAKEVIYDVTSGRYKMSGHIYNVLEECPTLDDWEGIQIFNEGQIDLSLIEEEAEYVRSILTEKDEEERDDDFIDDAYLFTRRRRAAADLGLELPEWRDWNLISPFYSLYNGQVPCSISLERLRSWSIATEYDRVKLGVYMAVRSLAKDDVAVTTLQAIKWRSLGCRNEQEYNQSLRNKQLQAIVAKWHSRYFFAKILSDLQGSQLIIILSRQRHTFVSASILEEDAFIEACADKLRRICVKAKEKRVTAQRKQMNCKLTEILNKLTN